MNDVYLAATNAGSATPYGYVSAPYDTPQFSPTGTIDFYGTSASTPLVSGVAALLMEANPLLSAAEIVKAMSYTCSPIAFGPYG